MSRSWGAPVAAQVGLLIAVCLIGAQLIALAVVTLSPPAAPQVYRVSEIAADLQGCSLQPRLGGTLIRSRSDQPPRGGSGDAISSSQRIPPFDPGRLGIDRQAAALAAQLGVPIEKVGLVRPIPNRLVRAMTGRLASQPFQPGGPGPGPPGPRLGAPTPFRDNPAFIRPGPRPAEFELVGGAFVAGVEMAGGHWTIVRSSPEPFPNDWERKVALWLAGCLILAVPAVWWFARRITVPIQQFAQAAERLGRDPHAPLLALGGPAEIGMAAGAFNEMQARLKRYVGDRTAMVGAISHDLRTPLARIRFKLEAKTPDRDAILSDVEKMEAMIASVLAFIRDAAAVDQREDLDLLSVIEVVVDDAALIGGDVQLAEASEDAAPLTVRGDAVALQRLFGNLVDNALKYGGAARVRIRQADRQAVVEIEDDGPGLSSAELARVFEPFYRADASRNLDQGGVGLGLAVARSLARAHGGDVELISRPGGLTARVGLPLV